ncbi:peptidase [Comamonas serinivorans]|uniref:ATP-dependent Clp protease proteolytic subunit n=1 Tax=Comamonas serinivorans TaxID=1082851 RepID=A0A1Y0EMV9_9BURK|nr:head maturation protease, ClpP-related [Comamonas serinivorans]ARU04748.1 peptidase [Comamonas serinivorans]
MSLRKLPELPKLAHQDGIEFDLSPRALAKWNPSLSATEDEPDNIINVLDVIGYDYWTGEGTTAKRIDAALRSIGRDRDVVVNINSPGGSMFEGDAIYSLLRLHKGKVTVRILGMAASAASIIAMAGDEIQISRAGWLMIHNAWIGMYGNRNDLREAADWLEPFDAAAADLYADRTGIDKGEILAMLDKETWIGGGAAVETGWADAILSTDKIAERDGHGAQNAVRQIDILLAKQGLPRSQRRSLLQQIKTGTQDAVGADTQDAIGKGTPNAAQLPVMVAKPALLSFN